MPSASIKQRAHIDRSSGSSTTEAAKTPKRKASPTPSASVLLISPTNEVLLLHRVSTSSTFPSAHVFPGGMVERADGEVPLQSTDLARHQDSIAYRTGAIRELFEESGILLARQSSSSAELLSLPLQVRNKGRHDIHSNKIHLTSWLAQYSPSAVLDTDSLLPFTRWISPITMPKRFTTQMYLYFLPISLEHNTDFAAVSDDIETKTAEWQYANEWLERARRGQIILYAAQFTLLYHIGKYLKVATTGNGTSVSQLESQRQKLRDFLKHGQPPWAEKVISPRTTDVTCKDGRSVVALDWPGPELEGVDGVAGDKEHVVLARYVNNVPRNLEVAHRDEVMKWQHRDKDNEPSKL